MNHLCLSLTAVNIADVIQQAETYRGMVDMAELCVDLLTPRERLDAASVPCRLAKSSGRALPLILSIRRVEDGGRWGERGESEEERADLLETLTASGDWAWVELENDKPLENVVQAARASGTQIIRSCTDLSGDILNQPVSELALYLKKIISKDAIPKLAVECGSSRQLLTLARLSMLDVPRKILIGLGEYGFPSRILAGKFGSLWTYSTPADAEKSPASFSNQLDPATLNGLYGYKDIHAETPIYAVTGNPIAHSQSPHIHNRWLRQYRLPGAYIPIRSDDVGALLETCDILGITGLSATVPHKEKCFLLCDYADYPARCIGAANTLVRRGEGWCAHNTDAVGFMLSLLLALNLRNEKYLKGRKILVIGAGGAARAAVHSLAKTGAHIVILNRTLEKAALLAAEIGCQYGSLKPESKNLLDGIDIVIQTTSVGMYPDTHREPLPWWSPAGCALVYDMIYEPKETVFLRRAVALGVPVVNGEGMLKAQAARQFELFTGVSPEPT